MAEEDRQLLQRFVESLFAERKMMTRLDAVLRAEALDLPADLVGIVTLLPPGNYTRQRLCNQLNSALKGHGWNSAYGTVE
jgi:hypothetical protein